MRERVLFFDLLRCVAAVAVIAIHVLAPYRHELGNIPFGEWATAVVTNSVTRWAVPVFILITGALMLNDRRPFNMEYYVKRRLGKVVIPFVLWSLFYAYLSGWSATGFDGEIARETLVNAFAHETYYHLGFFYYFIPLYFVIPMFQWLVKSGDETTLVIFVIGWLITTTFYLFGFDGPWSVELWLYSGYLPLGYLLWKKVPPTAWTLVVFIVLGVMALGLTAEMVISNSMAAERYTVGRWLSYKTLNVVLAASMIFIVCRHVGERLNPSASRIVSFISQHSLGIYLLHPIFLWPMKAYGWYEGHPAWVIPVWVVLSGAGALATSWLLSRSEKTRWVLP
ncbi:acyltransferase [Vibrio nereis]|uniref:Acyltransferase 3 domain-containing protein n=1 Tax=Vibrio nereis TaxID=693 RepID=A0A0M0HJM3_VIBNE|nr:acyltransferase family protein [Vibrio nereis]KOO02294.1 hypothetical protein AKJ17_16155 [Vibrio nereis]